jgi:hypothetical protein
LVGLHARAGRPSPGVAQLVGQPAQAIWRAAGGDGGKGWGNLKRRARYEFLKDANLNSGAPKHEVRLPCTGAATPTERVYIEEREVLAVAGDARGAPYATDVAKTAEAHDGPSWWRAQPPSRLRRRNRWRPFRCNTAGFSKRSSVHQPS